MRGGGEAAASPAFMSSFKDYGGRELGVGHVRDRARGTCKRIMSKKSMVSLNFGYIGFPLHLDNAKRENSFSISNIILT